MACNANNVLIGLGGDGILSGQGGRDVLIGGSGADVLDGGAGEDLLVGGSTAWQMYLPHVFAVFMGWSSTAPGAEYPSRVATLSAPEPGWYPPYPGFPCGPPVLNEETVTNYGAPDVLTGGPLRDWFVIYTNDSITDLNFGGPEIVTLI